MEVWPFMPQANMQESMEWRTDVLDSRAKEQRVCLRTWPRVGVRYKHILSPAQFAQAKLMARAIGTDRLYVPLWADIREQGALASGASVLTLDTTKLRLGTCVLIWEDCQKYETKAIASFDANSVTLATALSNSYANAVLVPCAEGHIVQGPNFTRDAHDHVLCSVELRAIEPVPTGSSPIGQIHRTYDIYLYPNVITAGYEDSYEVADHEFDSVLGEIERHDAYLYPRAKSFITFDVQSTDELWSIRSWLQELKGRLKAFWMPSWNNDIIINKTINSGDTYFQGAPTQFRFYPEQRDVVVVWMPATGGGGGGGGGGGWGNNYGNDYGGSTE